MLQSHADHLLCLSQSVQHHLSLLHDAYICSFLENLVTNKEKWCRKSTGEEECEKRCQLVSVLDVKGQVGSWDTILLPVLTSSNSRSAEFPCENTASLSEHHLGFSHL